MVAQVSYVDSQSYLHEKTHNDVDWMLGIHLKIQETCSLFNLRAGKIYRFHVHIRLVITDVIDWVHIFYLLFALLNKLWWKTKHCKYKKKKNSKSKWASICVFIYKKTEWDFFLMKRDMVQLLMPPGLKLFKHWEFMRIYFGIY